MTIWEQIKAEISAISNISSHIDTEAAAASIRSNVFFRGPNVWILAFSIIIASVGLNVNSTAVIIGAMLISPLMGPIIGIGLGLGITDTRLIKSGLKNLLVMVLISLLASFLYFLVTPLKLANPTELLARTNPTIYDVMIALFGGAAGILELSRKEKGTVLSGVAIATALMPPLCTAGYGLATATFKYFFGALLLFIINGVFIIIATYVMSKILGYKSLEIADSRIAKRTRNIISVVMILVIVPSVWSAVLMIRDNTLTQNAARFVSANKTLSSGYIYDYEVKPREGGKIALYIAGSVLDDLDKERLQYSAKEYGIDPEKLEFFEHKIVQEDASADKLVKGIYERTDSEINKKDAQIYSLEAELAKYKKEQIPYVQLARELRSQYPQISDVFISRGASVAADNDAQTEGVLVVVTSSEEIQPKTLERLADWIKVRLSESSATVISRKRDDSQAGVLE